MICGGLEGDKRRLADVLMADTPSASSPPAMRSAFRDWTADHAHDRDLAEMALAHTIGDKTEFAYLRSNLLEPRSGLMQAWAAFVTAGNPQRSGRWDGPRVPV
jgi:hypothetical protein